MELLKLKVTPVNFIDRRNTLLKYGITHAVHCSCIYETMYFIINITDKTTEGLIGVEEALDRYGSVKDACEDFFLLPKEVQEKAYKNSDVDIVDLLKNHIASWFTWDDSPEGYQFWYNWEKTIEQICHSEIRVFKVLDESKSDFGVIDWDKFKTISTKADDSHFETVTDIKCDKSSWTRYPYSYEIQKELYNLLKREENESRLQKQEDPLRRGDSGKPIRLHSRKHKARVAVQHLGYKKIVGRG